jgi:signal transduction histidine kinase
MIIYSFCCFFNFYSCWSLESSDRKAYFLSKDLENKLAAESEKLRREAEAKSEAERVIVAYLCHEIRNPFNGVFGFAELIDSALARLQRNSKASGDAVLAKGAGSGRAALAQAAAGREVLDSVQDALTEVREWCSNIIVNSKHIRDILDNVLDLSKLEQGTLQLEQTPILVSELGKQIHQLQRSTARKGVQFVIEVEPKGLVIEGDHQRWRQMLVNLVSNAIKFTHEGLVVLRIRQCNDGTDERALQVEVCDTGVGISELEQGRMFQKYRTRYQQQPLITKAGSEALPISAAEASLTKGTGLGLVIAQRIANLLGTRIEIESPWCEGRAAAGEGASAQGREGTRFYFTVPQCIVRASLNPSLGLPGSHPERHHEGLSLSGDNSEGDGDGSSGGGGEIRLTHNRFLVVDDDIMNRMTMSTKLTQVLLLLRALILHMACAILIAPYYISHPHCTHTALIPHKHNMCTYSAHTISIQHTTCAYCTRTLTHNCNAPHPRAPLLRFIPVC